MAEALADLGEIEARGLYRAQGYPSMYAFCVGRCHMTEQAALKRISAARAAREFPAVFEALANGRLHLTAVVTLASKLTPENTQELLAAAAHKTTFEIQRLLAERFPRPDLPTVMTPLATPLELSPENVPKGLSLRRVEESQAIPEVPPPSRARVTQLSAERVALQVTISRSTHDKILRAKDLLGHQMPSGCLEQVLDRALDALIEKLEQRKYGATDRPRESSRQSQNPRYVPARVRRAVRKRDQDQCTFVAADGRRCGARRFLEFDHIEPLARGGRSTVENLRLLCRAHNQHQAERMYGSEFMKAKREEVASVAARKRIEEVIPWLRALGCRLDEARRAAEHSESIPGAPLEDRVRLAVSRLRPRGCRRTPVSGSAAAGLS